MTDKEKQTTISGTAGKLREFFKFMQGDKYDYPDEMREALKEGRKRYDEYLKKENKEATEKKLKGEQKQKDENNN